MKEEEIRKKLEERPGGTLVSFGVIGVENEESTALNFYGEIAYEEEAEGERFYMHGPTADTAQKAVDLMKRLLEDTLTVINNHDDRRKVDEAASDVIEKAVSRMLKRSNTFH